MTTDYTKLAMRVSLVREGEPLHERPMLENPAAGARFLAEFIPDDGREHFGVILLSTRNQLIGVVEVSVGCLTASLVHPREVFGPAITGCAAALVLYHNHPSGHPEPSAEDLALTRRLTAAGAVLGIQILDHLVIGNGSGRYVSLHERGLL